MSRDLTIVELFPSYGIVRGRLDPVVFKMATDLPGKKQWKQGQLFFELSEPNLNMVRERLKNATWKHEADMPLPKDLLLDKKKKIAGNKIKIEFSRKPREGQEEAFRKLAPLDVGALFMDMGTGKSYVAIHLAAWWWTQGFISRVLLMAPNEVERQWLMEQLKNNAPKWFKWDGMMVKGNKRVMDKWLKSIDAKGRQGVCQWLFMNVELMSGKADRSRGLAYARKFIKGGRTLIICDESTRIKTATSQRTRNVTALRDACHKRLILSGRPTTKGLVDLFSQYRFLDPDIIGTGSVTTFKQRYTVRGGWENRQIVGYQNVEELLAKLEPYTFTMRKTSEYPPVEVEKHHTLNSEQKRIYKELKDDLFTWINQAREVGPGNAQFGVACANAAVAMMRMQQVTCGYIQYRNEETDEKEYTILNTNRAELTLDLVEESGDQPCLIYCAYHPCLDMVRNEFDRKLADKSLAPEDRHRYSYIEISGRVSKNKRSEDLDRFKRGEVMNMIGTAASGGIGLDLSMASVTIYYSNTNSSEDREQSKARTDRIGQVLYKKQKGVTYIDLIGSPICRKIIDNNNTKKSIGDLVMSLDETELDI